MYDHFTSLVSRISQVRFLPVGLAIVVYLVSLPVTRSEVGLGDDPAHVIGRVLSDGTASGGVEITNGCEDEVKVPLRIAGGTIDEKLTSIQTSIPTLRWKNNALAYRVTIGTTDVESLMNVVIPPTTVSIGNIETATDELLNKPEVNTRIAQSNLKLYSLPLGFSSVRSTKAQEQSELRLPVGSVADDLDRFGAAFGQRIWLYTSRRCQGTLTGRVLWLR
jgi:hypothetical protein